MAERTLELAGLALAILLLLRFVPPAARVWAIYAGVKRRRLADAGPGVIPVPPELAGILAELAEIGFRRVGERYTDIPGRGPVVEWLWADEPGETYVAVVPSRIVGGLMACYTAFADWAWLQTNFPRGETIDRETYVARFVASSPTDAVRAHRAQIARLRATHGDPRTVRTVADSLVLDAEYRTRHGGVTLRRLTWRVMTPAFLSAGLAIICGLLLLLDR